MHCLLIFFNIILADVLYISSTAEILFDFRIQILSVWFSGPPGPLLISDAADQTHTILLKRAKT